MRDDADGEPATDRPLLAVNTAMENLMKDLAAAQQAVDSFQDVNPNSNTYAAFRNAYAIGLDRLNQLKATYLSFIERSTKLLAVEGAGAAEFSRLAVENGPVVVVPSQEVYRRLAEGVWPMVAANHMSFDTNQYVRLIETLAIVGRDLDIAFTPRPAYQAHVLQDFADLQRVIKSMIIETCGHELMNLMVRKIVVDTATETRFNAFVPVVLLDSTTEEQDFLRRNLFTEDCQLNTLVVDDEPDADAVIDLLGTSFT